MKKNGKFINEYCLLKEYWDAKRRIDSMNGVKKLQRLNNFLKEMSSVEGAIEIIKKEYLKDSSVWELIEKRAATQEMFFKQEKILVIPYYIKSKIPFLKNMSFDNYKFVFIKGEKDKIIEILNTDIKFSSAVVGSRETEQVWGEWFRNNLNEKSKIYVSGLANGADSIGHRIAIEKNKKIVIFPGYPVTTKPSKAKMDIWNYALKNGMIISSEDPFETLNFPASALLQRNIQMAETTSETFALWFKENSGTHWHIVEALKNNHVYIPREVYKANYDYLFKGGFFKYLSAKYKENDINFTNLKGI